MDFLFYSFIGFILFLAVYNNYPVATTLTVAGVAAYFVYRNVLRSQWLARWDRNSKAAAIQREDQRFAKQIADEWQATEYLLPTRQEFVEGIREECHTERGLNLRYEVLQPILSHVGWLYEHFGTEDKHLPIATTKLQIEAFQSCVTLGIRAFGEKAPLLLQPAKVGPTPFTATRTLSELLGQSNPAEALAGAYAALVEDLAEMKEDWRRIGLMDVYHGPLDMDDKPPDMDTYVDIHIPPGDDWTQAQMDKVKRGHAKLVRDYEKRLQQRNEALPPLERVFLGTPFWTAADQMLPLDTTFSDPVVIPTHERYSGTWIIAPQGMGKTNLLWQLLNQDLKDPDRTVIMMDSKGDFLKPFRHHPRALLIDKDTVSINPFQFGTGARALSFFEYLFSSLLDAKFTRLQQTVWRDCLELLLRLPNPSLETYRQMLQNGLTPEQRLIAESCPPATRDFFLQRDERGGPPEFQTRDALETRRQLLWRLRSLLSTEYLRRMFAASTSSHDFLSLLDSKKLIIIDNNKDDLGDEGAEFFGRFFIALVWMAATARSKLDDNQKTPVSFYIDECHTVIKTDAKVRGIIQECRSQKIGLTLAHQFMSDIGTEAQPALFNCAVRIANADEEAPEIAPRLDARPQQLKLKPHNFLVHIKTRGTELPVKTPFAIRVPFLDLASIPQKPPQECVTPTPHEPVVVVPFPKKKQKPFKKDRRAVREDGVEDF